MARLEPLSLDQVDGLEEVERTYQCTLGFVPNGLRNLVQWVGWARIKRKSSNGKVKLTKVPLDPHTGKAAKTDDRTTWGTFDEAVALVEKKGLAGVGFVFTEDDPFTVGCGCFPTSL